MTQVGTFLCPWLFGPKTQVALHMSKQVRAECDFKAYIYIYIYIEREREREREKQRERNREVIKW